MGSDSIGLMVVAIVCGLMLCVLYPLKWILDSKKRRTELQGQDISRCPKCNSLCRTVYKVIGTECTNERAGFYCKACDTIWNEKGEFIGTSNRT